MVHSPASLTNTAPKAAFVYATCIAGIIGDDVDAICRRVSQEKGIPVLAVHSEGFKGTKKDGYKAACDAMAQIVGTGPHGGDQPLEPEHHGRVQYRRRSMDHSGIL